ncbi:putative diphthamide biosynthesis protein 1 [Paratrimastix pyriformis]|uniref:2-(3-amino-3-carboxypropyl)histidine synthase subunit 1 n=1 Tax=Paratrimastix pyriformis TaxID=342808 RepID=A0ABQ8USF4_9EUKA|nr:putative diphthamide biosynthesis protein 1 [Paratrimastix pyriformis]
MELRYRLELAETTEFIKKHNAHLVALQFPEGLFQIACEVSDTLERMSGAECFILGDVAYGACCVADEYARSLGADVLIHYAHRGLVEERRLALPVHYVICEFTETAFPHLPPMSGESPLAPLYRHLDAALRAHFPPATSRLALLTTAQHSRMLKVGLSGAFDALPWGDRRVADGPGRVDEYAARALGDYRAVCFPANAPLPDGEILGCTAPTLDPAQWDAIVCVVDGRFHTEAAILANPSIPVYRYEPHVGALTRETIDRAALAATRCEQMARARRARRVGLVASAMGKQASPAVMKHVEEHLRAAGREVSLLAVPEITPAALERALPDVEAWVEVGCPRLALDWGTDFPKPVLTPYEALAAFGTEPLAPAAPAAQGDASCPAGCGCGAVQPMDQWARGRPSGPWTHGPAAALHPAASGLPQQEASGSSTAGQPGQGIEAALVSLQ